SLNVVSPTSGSRCVLATTTPRSGLKHCSLLIVIGSSLPISPAGIWSSVRLPCTRRPSIVFSPSETGSAGLCAGPAGQGGGAAPIGDDDMITAFPAPGAERI